MASSDSELKAPGRSAEVRLAQTRGPGASRCRAEILKRGRSDCLRSRTEGARAGPGHTGVRAGAPAAAAPTTRIRDRRI